MDKINLRAADFNDNDSGAEPFADTVISIS